MDQINFNGRKVTLAPLDSYTMDEALVLWDYAKMSLDQVADMDGFVPGVVMALIHVSVQREFPSLKAKEIRREVGELRVVDLAQIFEDITVEVEEVPPPSAPASDASSDTSGRDSKTPGEDSQDPTDRNGSGTPGSAISAISDPVTLGP